MNVPIELKGMTLVNTKGVLVKLFKFEEVTKTKSGLVDPLFEQYHTEGGKFASKLSDAKYQSRGVVVKISPSAQKYIDEAWAGEKLSIGDISLVSPTSVNRSEEFLINRELPVTGDKGFIMVHPNSIDALENNKIEITYE